jgi:hypothetical protein
MLDDVQFLKRKLRALAQAKVDRLKGEEREFELLLGRIKQKNKQKKRR